MIFFFFLIGPLINSLHKKFYEINMKSNFGFNKTFNDK